VATVSKGGRAQIIARCLPFVGDGYNGEFCKKMVGGLATNYVYDELLYYLPPFSS
jgi:hypothetical protein